MLGERGNPIPPRDEETLGWRELTLPPSWISEYDEVESDGYFIPLGSLLNTNYEDEDTRQKPLYSNHEAVLYLIRDDNELEYVGTNWVDDDKSIPIGYKGMKIYIRVWNDDTEIDPFKPITVTVRRNGLNDPERDSWEPIKIPSNFQRSYNGNDIHSINVGSILNENGLADTHEVVIGYTDYDHNNVIRELEHGDDIIQIPSHNTRYEYHLYLRAVGEKHVERRAPIQITVEQQLHDTGVTMTQETEETIIPDDTELNGYPELVVPSGTYQWDLIQTITPESPYITVHARALLEENHLDDVSYTVVYYGVNGSQRTLLGSSNVNDLRININSNYERVEFFVMLGDSTSISQYRPVKVEITKQTNEEVPPSTSPQTPVAYIAPSDDEMDGFNIIGLPSSWDDIQEHDGVNKLVTIQADEFLMNTGIVGTHEIVVFGVNKETQQRDFLFTLETSFTGTISRAYDEFDIFVGEKATKAIDAYRPVRLTVVHEAEPSEVGGKTTEQGSDAIDQDEHRQDGTDVSHGTQDQGQNGLSQSPSGDTTGQVSGEDAIENREQEGTTVGAPESTSQDIRQEDSETSQGTREQTEGTDTQETTQQDGQSNVEGGHTDTSSSTQPQTENGESEQTQGQEIPPATHEEEGFTSPPSKTVQDSWPVIITPSDFATSLELTPHHNPVVPFGQILAQNGLTGNEIAVYGVNKETNAEEFVNSATTDGEFAFPLTYDNFKLYARRMNTGVFEELRAIEVEVTRFNSDKLATVYPIEDTPVGDKPSYNGKRYRTEDITLAVDVLRMKAQPVRVIWEWKRKDGLLWEEIKLNQRSGRILSATGALPTATKHAHPEYPDTRLEDQVVERYELQIAKLLETDSGTYRVRVERDVVRNGQAELSVDYRYNLEEGFTLDVRPSHNTPRVGAIKKTVTQTEVTFALNRSITVPEDTYDIAYQWMFRKTSQDEYTEVPNGNSTSYVIQKAEANEALEGEYQLRVKFTPKNMPGREPTLIHSDTPNPVFRLTDIPFYGFSHDYHEIHQQIPEGETATFGVTSTLMPEQLSRKYTFRWFHKNRELPELAGRLTHTITDATLEDAGEYALEITFKEPGEVPQRHNYTLVVTRPQQEEDSLEEEETSVAGDDIPQRTVIFNAQRTFLEDFREGDYFSVQALKTDTAPEPVRYQWYYYVDGRETAISGETSTQLQMPLDYRFARGFFLRAYFETDSGLVHRDSEHFTMNMVYTNPSVIAVKNSTQSHFIENMSESGIVDYDERIYEEGEPIRLVARATPSPAVDKTVQLEWFFTPVGGQPISLRESQVGEMLEIPMATASNTGRYTLRVSRTVTNTTAEVSYNVVVRRKPAPRTYIVNYAKPGTREKAIDGETVELFEGTSLSVETTYDVQLRAPEDGIVHVETRFQWEFKPLEEDVSMLPNEEDSSTFSSLHGQTTQTLVIPVLDKNMHSGIYRMRVFDDARSREVYTAPLRIRVIERPVPPPVPPVPEENEPTMENTENVIESMTPPRGEESIIPLTPAPQDAKRDEFIDWTEVTLNTYINKMASNRTPNINEGLQQQINLYDAFRRVLRYEKPDVYMEVMDLIIDKFFQYRLTCFHPRYRARFLEYAPPSLFPSEDQEVFVELMNLFSWMSFPNDELGIEPAIRSVRNLLGDTPYYARFVAYYQRKIEASLNSDGSMSKKYEDSTNPDENWSYPEVRRRQEETRQQTMNKPATTETLTPPNRVTPTGESAPVSTITDVVDTPVENNAL